MTTTEPLARYVNGNCTVTLGRDGTKVREWAGPEAIPLLPESIDLKITDYCDAGCAYCHERSTVRGLHGSSDFILNILDGMLPGTEVAIGGGNPLDHPRLEAIIFAALKRGLVPNLTVNGLHVRSHAETLRKVRGMLGGLGVSYFADEDGIAEIADDNTVVHVIAGVDSPFAVTRMAGLGVRKFLILGYKRFGRGERYRPEGLGKWRYFLPSLLRRGDLILSFDNLGLEQLGVRALIGEEAWSRHYMGDDGRFTMYVDAVRQEFAISSTSPRLPAEGRSVGEMFRVVRGMTEGEGA